MSTEFLNFVKHNQFRNSLEISSRVKSQSFDDNKLTSGPDLSQADDTLTALTEILVVLIVAVECLVVTLRDYAQVLRLGKVRHF